MKFTNGAKSPIYLSIAEEYKRYIELGVLQYEEKLPSVRSLATDLGINPNTVDRAYQELEAEGYITSIPKKGSFVSYQKKPLQINYTECLNQLEIWRNNNMSKETLLELVEEVYQGGNNHD